MNAKEKIEELLEASEDGTITAAQVTEAGLHRSVLQESIRTIPLCICWAIQTVPRRNIR